MRRIIQTLAGLAVLALFACPAGAQAPPKNGTEEFGLSQRELVQAIEKVEALIAKCMREEGFTYVPADYATVRNGMSSDKNIPGMSDEEFVQKYGWGISTLYDGKPPQLGEGYNPARVGLGARNVEIYRKLSPADQVAYNRALLGTNLNVTFAVALESEDFSGCGGCTRTAIAQVFKPDQLTANYYNPTDALVHQDPRIKEALRYYALEMRKAGFTLNSPDEAENHIRHRLDAITEGGTLTLAAMSPEQRAALKDLQTYELRAAKKNRELKEAVFDPLEAKIQRELFSREIK
jgi:hypothetical protein